MAWTLLAYLSVVATPVTLVTGGRWVVVAGSVALLATACAFRATRYNRRTHPALRRLWEQSFMCARCGEVFSSG